MYNFPCEHCSGTVEERLMDQEAIRHKGCFVILEKVPIGVCNQCGARYFDATVLHRAAEIGRGKVAPSRTLQVPVDLYLPSTGESVT